jgi:hypothetical protein
MGSARSHGCIRLANSAINWLVHAIGATRVAGTPGLGVVNLPYWPELQPARLAGGR